MAFDVEWSRSAKKDFKEILEYIAKDSPVNSQRVAAKIRGKIELLRSFPGLGHHAARYKSTNSRQVIVYRYRIIFSATKQLLIIKRIVHGARNFPK